VAEGIKTEVFKAAVKTREGGKTKMSLLNALKKEDSQVLKKGDAISELCCFSILGGARTVDLVAPTNRVRDDWLRALRMLLVHMNTMSSLCDVANQKRVMGDLKTSAGTTKASAILTDNYKALKFEVHRGVMGLGILMDSATNQIVDIEEDGSAINSGLKIGDVITTVDKTVVTSIVDGMLEPRAAVSSAIDPTREALLIAVFRASAATC